MTKTATEQQRKDLIEGLPTRLLTLEVRDGRKKSVMTFANGGVAPIISSGYMGGVVFDAIDTIMRDPNSRGRKYYVEIRGER